jgi:hypothetical protein
MIGFNERLLILRVYSHSLQLQWEQLKELLWKIIKNMICNGLNRPHRSNTGKNYYDYHDSDNKNNKYILVKLI